MIESDTPAVSELLFCQATGKPISSDQKLFGATRGDSPVFVPLSVEAVGMIPESIKNRSPGNPSCPIFIHEASSADDGRGNYLAKDFRLGKFQFAIAESTAAKYLSLHIRSSRKMQNGNERSSGYLY